MITRFLLLYFCLLTTSLSFADTSIFEQSLIDQMKTQGLPIVNSMMEGSGMLPRSFRTSQIIPMGQIQHINAIGLKALNVSGSSQPSPDEMDSVKKFWNNRKVHWIALRKEEVWAIQPKEGSAIVVSQLHGLKWWTGEDFLGRRNVDQIHIDEKELINTTALNRTLSIYGNRDLEPSQENGEAYEMLFRLDIVADIIYTLQQLVEQRGMLYHRIIDNKFGPISWESIDALVNIIRDIPQEDAVHFHCKKGQSRTTIAMVLFDMMRNADKLSAREIIHRQGPEGLGGASLEADQATQGKSGVAYKFSWEPTLVRFHEYCLEQQNCHFAVSFSEWCQSKGIEKEQEISLAEFSKTLNIHSNIPGQDLPAFDSTTNPLVLALLDEGKQLPHNLRSTQDIHFNASFNEEGLDRVYAVASGQPTAQSAVVLFDKIAKVFPSREIIDVDLRDDEHWFVCSGSSGHDVYRKRLQSLEDEKDVAAQLANEKVIVLHAMNDHFTVTIAPTKIMTEQDVVEKLGVSYVRIPFAKFGKVLDEHIDRQVQLRLENTEAVIFYHCHDGKSNASLAMCIDDMLANAYHVSFEDILQRQHVLSGIDFDQSRLIFLASFYDYCKEQKPAGFAITWSIWQTQI